jgi:predicted enzyme related to lactoylglutathione lyase
MANAPVLFRVVVQVDDLEKATDFYATLLDIPGRRIPRGSRHYFDCGPVIFAVIDVSAGGSAAQPTPDNIYFAVSDLEAFHQRAAKLGCLSTKGVHGESGGEIVVRPWGERSFYAVDAWQNPLCFVDDKTLFTGY